MADWGLDALAADASVQASQARDDLRTISARDVEALEKCSDDLLKLAEQQWYDNAGGDEGEVGDDGDCAWGSFAPECDKGAVPTPPLPTDASADAHGRLRVVVRHLEVAAQRPDEEILDPAYDLDVDDDAEMTSGEWPDGESRWPPAFA